MIRSRIVITLRMPAPAWLVLILLLAASPASAGGLLVLQTDFGLADGAVASMKGVACSIDPDLIIHDLTHEIPPYDVWAAAYRLIQTAPYWPPGTVFVSVVDPGVGTERRSIALRTQSGHIFVSPDNGTLTLIADELGVAEVRQIDETVNRLSGSEFSHTFHGRDIYAHTGARIASGVMTFAQTGPLVKDGIERIPYQQADLVAGSLHGTIPILDARFGNVWTNIDAGLLAEIRLTKGQRLRAAILHGDHLVYAGEMPFVDSFGDVPVGQPLAYVNSLHNIALALNQGDFAATFGIASGSEWQIRLTPLGR